MAFSGGIDVCAIGPDGRVARGRRRRAGAGAREPHALPEPVAQVEVRLAHARHYARGGPQCARNRSASMAAMQPVPAAVMAWR